MLEIVINPIGATRKIPPRANRIAPVTCSSLDWSLIIRSISYYSISDIVIRRSKEYTLPKMLTLGEFQKQRVKMLDFYYSTESDFLDLIRIIPLENLPSTFSPKLYNILQSSCSQVENLLRLLCDRFQLSYSKNPDSIYKEYSDLVNKNDLLKNQRVLVLTVFDPVVSGIYPFENGGETGYPKWWQEYNMTKHYLPNGLKKGNLGNTLSALAGVYALHCMSYYAQYCKKDFFDKSYWDYPSTAFTGDGELIENWHNPIPESDIFYYAARYNEQGGI